MNLNEHLDALRAENASLQSALLAQSEILAARDEAQAALNLAASAITSLREEVSTAKAAEATAQATIATQTARITALESAQASADVIARRIVAEIGHRPLPLGSSEMPDESAPEPGTPRDYAAELKAISDPREKSLFWNKHEAELRKIITR